VEPVHFFEVQTLGTDVAKEDPAAAGAEIDRYVFLSRRHVRSLRRGLAFQDATLEETPSMWNTSRSGVATGLWSSCEGISSHIDRHHRWHTSVLAMRFHISSSSIST
jgi:hypothetical protein